MNVAQVIENLKSDHEEFRALGRAIESLMRGPAAQLDRGRLVRLVNEFKQKLERHSSSEDAELYPAVRGMIGKSALIDHVYMNHLDHEHRSIDGHLSTLLEQISAERLMTGWGQTFAIFSVGLRSHMRREEEELFPEAQRLLG